MANKTIPDLTALGADAASGDLLEIADISNGNASRKITIAEAVGAIVAAIRANSGTADVSGVDFTFGTISDLGTPADGDLSACMGLGIAVKITAANYTVGTTDPRELYGGMIIVTSAATITAPAVVTGASFSVYTVGAIAVSVDPNASDLIVLDGTAQADGEKITNLSTAGDCAVLVAMDGTGWVASTNSWTNGG